jgi:hypothetical protein
MLVFLITLLSLATLFYVAAPLWARESASSKVVANRPLIERRDSLLRQIKELEFDYSMDKVETPDYNALRAELASEASRVIDKIEGQSGARPAERVLASNDLRRMEAALEIEVLVTRARKAKSQTWQCACGRVMGNADRFCASCGTPRAVENVPA